MLCKECGFAKVVVYGGKIVDGKCKHPKNINTDPVTGEIKTYNCSNFNQNEACVVGVKGSPDQLVLPPIKCKH